jgi:hypothetical protein
MMAGVHEDEVGSQFWYKVYRLGSIIRDREFWGIVIRATGNKYHSAPYDIMWWKPDGWAQQVYATPPDHITFPISIKDESIPDEVLAKATEIILRGGL